MSKIQIQRTILNIWRILTINKKKTVENLAEDLNKHFTKDAIQMPKDVQPQVSSEKCKWQLSYSITTVVFSVVCFPDLPFRTEASNSLLAEGADSPQLSSPSCWLSLTGKSHLPWSHLLSLAKPASNDWLKGGTKSQYPSLIWNNSGSFQLQVLYRISWGLWYDCISI